MIARGIALSVSLAWCTVAMGGADVIIQCVNDANCNPGAGGTDTAEVYMVGDQAQLLRFVQFDLSNSSPELTLSLPVLHGIPTSEIAPTGSLHFWDFSSTDTCGIGAMCGFGHVVDDDLSGSTPPGPVDVISMVYLGDLTDPDNPDLDPSFDNQWLLENGNMKKIGEVEFTCPDPSVGPLTLDLVNAAETDPGLGAIIEFGFNPRVTWRADTGDITGGTATVCGDVPTDANLVASVPACDSTLAGSAGNIIELEFDGMITAPAAGEIEIQQLAAGGGFTGGDLSGSFTYSVQPGNILRITATGAVFSHATWYAISNTGGWTGVADFKVDLQAAIGDANGDNFVTNTDVSIINAQVPCFAACDPRLDINGDGFITNTDVSIANSNVPYFNTSAKPSGHACNP